MRKFILLVLLIVSLTARGQTTEGDSQANIGGLLIASNFAQWTVPQGNQGGYSWSSPDFCKSNYAGATFNAFSNGTPVSIVDTGNPNNSETVTVLQFNSTAGGCSIQVNPTHVHNTFFFRSATAGLGEALAFAGQQLYQVILTPNFTKLGGLTATVTSAHGNSNVTILDQRSAVIVPYLWNGTAYVANPFAGGVSPGGTTGAVQYNAAGSFGGLNGTGLLKLNAAGAPTIATSGTDYALPNANTTGSAGSLSAASALPNGTTATTQTTGDSTTKVATDAFVIANQSTATIPATSNVLKGSGSAGAAAIATPGTDYVAPSTTVNGHALSANVVVSASDLTTGTLPHAQLPTLISGDIPNNAASTSSTAANLSGTPTLPNGTLGITQSPGDNTARLATDAFVLANGVGGTPCTGVVNGIQYNNAGSFGCNAALTFTPSTAALTIGSPTPSILGTNSGPMTWTTPYNTGSGTALDTYQAYIQIGSGVNPFSNLVFNHTSGSTGGGEIEFAIPSFFTNGIVAQSGGIQDDDLTPSAPSVCTDGSSKLTTSGCSGGGGGGITPQTFGGFGDAATIGNGCTTNGTTSIVCAAAPFVSGDVGKLVCVQGAGAAGIGFCSAIATVTSNTTVVVSATPSTNVTSAPSVFGHDDVVAIQSCFNYSGAHNTQCVLAPIGVFVNTSVGYLVYSAGLTIPTHANITGGADYGGTTIFSEYNGDLISLPTSTASLAAGQPVSGVTFANVDLIHDPSWPNGRGIHLNSAPGIFGFGGMYYSTFTNVSDQSAALEALWMEGHLNSNNNPNQYITFNNFIANGPNQSHPANEIKITGIQAQIIFENGAINGTSNADYPNPLISITEETTGQADSPVDIKFFGYTYEVGTQGLYVGNGTSNIHFDNGYIEAVESPLIVESNVQSLTFRGNHIANSGNVGAVAQFSSSSSISATLQDNYVYGSTAPAAFAVCSGGTNNFNIDFLNNNSSLMSSANCATNHEGTGAALFQAFGTTDTVDASSTVITTIRNLNIQPGKTLTLKALSGGVGSFSLGTGGTPSGNDYPIDIGTFTSPLVVTAGNSITLALLDASGAPVYTVVGGTSLPATLLVSSETLASSANPIYSVAVNTTYVTLGGNITGPTMAAGADGQHKTLCFKQGAGPFTVASPTNVHGFFTVGITNGDYNCQSFVYNAANSIWLADSPGVTNQ